MAVPLFRGNLVQESCDESIDNVREPHGKPGRHCPCVDEHLAESQEKYVGESQGDADGYVPSDTSAPFLG